jgi:hypothetical protein
MIWANPLAAANWLVMNDSPTNSQGREVKRSARADSDRGATFRSTTVGEKPPCSAKAARYAKPRGGLLRG